MVDFESPVLCLTWGRRRNLCCSLFIELYRIGWFIIVYFSVFVKRKINVLGVLPEDASARIPALY